MIYQISIWSYSCYRIDLDIVSYIFEDEDCVDQWIEYVLFSWRLIFKFKVTRYFPWPSNWQFTTILSIQKETETCSSSSEPVLILDARFWGDTYLGVGGGGVNSMHF